LNKEAPTDAEGNPVLDKRGRPLHSGAFKKGGKGSSAAGRPSKGEANLFTGLVTCAVTGARLHIIHSLGRKPKDGERERKVYTYLAREHMTTPRLHFDYSVFERAILTCLRELSPRDILPDPLQADQRHATETRLTDELSDTEAALLTLRQRWDRSRSPT